MIVKVEIMRKSIHMLTLLIPFGYLLLHRHTMLWMTGSLVLFALLVELARFHWTDFSKWFNKRTGLLLRKHEKADLTGATYLFIGSFLSILLFDKWIALTVLFILIISDGLSALVGRVWGRIRIYHKKTLEGSLTFLVSAAIIVLLIFKQQVWIGMAGVLSAAFVDIFVKKVDDNLTIPLIGGGVMQLLSIGFN